MEHLQKQHLTTTMLKFMGGQFTLKKKVKGILYIQHLLGLNTFFSDINYKTDDLLKINSTNILLINNKNGYVITFNTQALRPELNLSRRFLTAHVKHGLLYRTNGAGRLQ